MRLRSVLIAVVPLLTIGSFAAAGRRHAMFAWPSFMLVRGDGLGHPVVIGRSPGGDVTHGDIQRLYRSFDAAHAPSTGWAARRHYEVAEFWAVPPLPSGRPPYTLDFERASTFARIYVGTAAAPPVWVGRWQGRENVPLIIGDSGVAILTRAGLALR